MLNILIVEDDEPTLRYCAEIIEKVGKNIKTFTAQSGNEALSILQQNTIDGAFLDIELPDIDGLSLATKIRDIDKYHFLPIVFATGHDYDHPETYKKHHIFDYISKPFDEAIFQETTIRFTNEIKAQKKLIHKRERALPFKAEEGNVYYRLEDILYVEKCPGKKTLVVTKKEKRVVSYIPLAKIKAAIDDELFAYCTKSCIVNVSNIVKIVSISSKTWDIFFRGAEDIKCSLSYNYRVKVTELLQKR